MKRVTVAIFSLLAVLAVLVYVGVPVPLGLVNERLERLAGSLIDRQVVIGGPTRLKVSLHPSLSIGDLSIADPNDWDSDAALLHARTGSASIDLLSLLQGKIRIETLVLDQVTLRLVTRTDRSTNFSFSGAQRSSGNKSAGPEFAGLDSVSLSAIEVIYQDELSGADYRLTVDKAQGRGSPDDPLQLSASGKIAALPYSLDVEGGTLSDLLRGQGRWPLTKGRVLVGDVTLKAGGALNLDQGAGNGFLRLSLEGENLADIGAPFDVALPDLGVFSLSANISLAPAFVHFTTLELEAQAGTLAGDLAVSLHGSRPLVGGSLQLMPTGLKTAETVPLLAPENDSAGEKSETASAQTPDPDSDSQSGEFLKTELPFHLLSVLDADLSIGVGDIDSNGVRLSNIRSTVSLVDGELVVPLAVDLLGMKIRAQLEARTGDGLPEISGVVSTPGAELGPMLSEAKIDTDWDGRLGSFTLSGAGRGATVEELLAGLSLSALLAESSFARNEAAVLSTDHLSFELLLPEKSATLSAKGAFLDSPLNLRFSLDDSAASIDLQACDSEFAFDGRRLDENAGRSSFELSFAGEKLCGLLHPVARFIDENPRFSAELAGMLSGQELSVDLKQLQLGELSADGHLQLQEGRNDLPRITGEIRSPKIDLTHILAQMERHSDEAEPEPAEQPPEPSEVGLEQYEQARSLVNQILATEIMPVKRFLSTEVRVTLGVQEVVTGMLGVSDVELTIEAEQGKLRHSPFQARIGGSLFSGSVAIDLRDELPSAHLDLETDHVSLPDLLAELNLEGIPAISASHVGLDMNFEGNTVKEMLLNAHYRARLEEGRLEIEREPLAPLLLTVEEADYIAYPYQPAMLSLNGEINSLPLHFESMSSGFFARGTEKPVLVSVQGEIGDNRIEVDGRINRHHENGETFRLSSAILGVRMDTLNDILGLDLPPLGPYEIEGTLASRAEKSLGLYDMGVRVGDSSLWGEMILTATPDPETIAESKLKLQSRLEARTIQLNDFQFGQWSPVTGLKQRRVAGYPSDPPAEVKEDAETRYNLFSAEVAEKLDATLNVNVQEVLSGEDQLGRGFLEARLEQGVYTLEELQLSIPGGTVQISGKLLPREETIGAELFMNIEDFDYGILIRRTQPDSTLKGRMNLILELDAEVDLAARLSENLNGRFRFGVIPEEFKAGALDLWAVNIIAAALPVMMKGSSSVVNCLVGDFVLEESLMEPDLFVLDTSNMRVNGKGLVNLRTSEINFVLNPKPKSAQFFSLATPVNVTGSILSPNIGVTTAGVIGTLFRQPLSIVTVPLQWLFTDNLERDGRTVCAAGMQWVKEAHEGEQQ